MLIAVGSKNPVKINAVSLAFKKVFPKKQIKIIGIPVESDVSDQPLSEEEAFFGAQQRAKKAQKKAKADLGVGIEGTIQKYSLGVLEGGMAVIVDKNKKTGFGSSAQFPLPKKAITQIKKGKELGDIIDSFTNKKNTKKRHGAFGFFTKNIITRTQAYQDAVICALAPWIQDKLY